MTSDSSQCYLWTFPGSPITIRIAVDVIWRLNLELDLELELDKSGKRRNAFGLLIGTLESGGALQVNITDYAAFSSELEAPGVAEQTDALARHLKHLPDTAETAQPGQRVVGLFRTQSESRPMVRDCDRPLLNMTDHPDIQVVLMIACGETDRRVAGFLFREGDAIHPFSFMDFEFDATLRNEPRSDFLSEDVASSATHDDAAPVPLPETTAAQLNPPATSGDSNARVRDRSAVRSRSFAIAVACLAGIVAGVLGTLGTWLVLTTWSVISPLNLRASAIDDGVAIVWTAPAPSVAGRLVVREKSEHTVIELDADQIASGKLFYGRVGGEAQFRLEVGPHSHPLMSDSITSIMRPTAPRN